MPELTLKDFENKIKQLIVASDYATAFRYCQQVLQVEPNNVKFIRLRNEITKRVQGRNKEIIENELLKYQPIFDSGQYEEYLKKLSLLQPYANDYPKIKDLIFKTTVALDKSYQSKKEQFIKEKIAEIETLSNQGNYNDALLIAHQIDQLGLHSHKIKKIIQHLSTRQINAELQKDDALFHTNKYEDINLSLLQIKRINPRNKKILRMIDRNKREAHLDQLDNQRDFIFRTLEEIRVLAIKKKYDQALELTNRILDIDPDNRQYLSFQRKFQNKVNKLAKAELIKQIFSNHQKYKTNYLQNPDHFILL